jgi:DNA-binding PadR family transcriptional regulator
MKEADFRKLLALLVINNLPKFRNSYDLTKVMAWKFDIIEIVDLTQSLENDNLVSRILNEGLYHYTITEKGKNYLRENYALLHSQTLKKYPEQAEFTNVLFQPSDINN